MAKSQNLNGLLKNVRTVRGEFSQVRVADIVDQLGQRSFGPLLLLAALPTLTPVSAIPGIATVGAIIILLTSAQLALGLHRLWLPEWVLHRSFDRSAIVRASSWLRPVATVVDKVVRPRLPWLVEPPFVVALAACCILLTFVMFPLQLVPFTSGIPSFPVAIFGLALIARDGLVAILGFISTAIVLGTAAIILFGGNFF
jgi:hypothetical protein